MMLSVPWHIPCQRLLLLLDVVRGEDANGR